MNLICSIFCGVYRRGRFDVSSLCCFQAEDGIRELVRSRGLGDVYKRQLPRGNAVTAVTSADQGENVCAFSHGQPVCMKLFLSLIHI